MSWANIPGWFDFDDIYKQAVDEAQDGALIVEVGCAFGRSLAYLAECVIASGKKIHVHAVDIWPKFDPDTITADAWGSEHANLVKEVGGDSYLAFERLMDAECPRWRGVVTIYRMPSVEAAKLHRAHSADLVFIDANHTYPFVKQDIEAWLEIVKPGGVIGGHDYTTGFPGVMQAVDEFFPNTPARRSSFWVRR